MTTERPLPIPPSSASPLPTSPSKFTFPSPGKSDPNLKPNPHPYAIKTTTTGLLTRSNSSSHNADATRHYYVPLSPQSSRSPESGRGHRASRSLNNTASPPTRASPRPLPVPPGHADSTPNLARVSGSTNDGGDGNVFPRRTRRADTLPSSYSPDSSQPLSVPENLPNNPKLWTPSQLATYLAVVLRVGSHGKDGEPTPVSLPLRVVKDIAAFAQARMINGRMFLRLNEADLESMGMNRKWREILLIASQELRQNVLKGRIWGPDISPRPSPGSTSPLPMAPFSSSLYNSSSSSLDLSADEAGNEDDAPRSERHRRGRVRGMVETFERSGSFSSESSLVDEGDDERSKLGRWLRQEGPIEEQPLRSPSPGMRPLAPEDPPKVDSSKDSREPTIQELLTEANAAAVPSTGSWGARAWEELDLGPGVTVKRIPKIDSSVVTPELEVQKTIIGHGSGKGSNRHRDREERRVVTAIFTPSQGIPAQDIYELTVNEMDMHEEAKSREACSQTEANLERAQSRDTNDITRLEQELLATRTLVEAFQKRLELVECKVLELEGLKADRELAEPCLTASAVQGQQDPGNRGLDKPTQASLTPLTSPSCLIPGALQLSSMDAQPQAASAESTDEEDEDEPSSLSDLPSYVLLVGFGVCAVVLRVVLRRVVGKGALTAWRT